MHASQKKRQAASHHHTDFRHEVRERDADAEKDKPRNKTKSTQKDNRKAPGEQPTDDIIPSAPQAHHEDRAAEPTCPTNTSQQVKGTPNIMEACATPPTQHSVHDNRDIESTPLTQQSNSRSLPSLTQTTPFPLSSFLKFFP